MKQFLFKGRLIILGCIMAVLCVAVPVATYAKSASAEAAPVAGGKLISGKPVHGVVSKPSGVSYTFTAVTGQHLTLAITNPPRIPAWNESADECIRLQRRSRRQWGVH